MAGRVSPGELSRLIALIYDAALDPALWPAVLEKTSGFVGGVAANLFSQDVARKSARSHFQHGLDPAYTRYYEEKLFGINPLFPAGLLFDVGQVISIGDTVPLAEFRRTRFFREYLAPQGYVDSVNSILEKTAVSCTMLAVIRGERQGPVDARARRRMALVVPHVQRAVLIGKVIDRHETEAAALADTLDNLAAAMLLVDGAGRLMHANAAGHGMLAAGDVLAAPEGRVLARERTATEALRDIFAAAEAGDGAVGTRGISLTLPSPADRPHVAHILPLTAGERRRAGTAYSAVAAMFVRPAGFDGTPTLFETVAETYRLTPTELRVLFAIVNVGGTPDVASVLGISEATVRTHLLRVFAKTGIRRQADLVKLIASHAIPLTG